MALIWCSISGHGYGHAAQTVPVLNALAEKVPHLTAILRTTVPADFFAGRLKIPHEIRPAEQDIGCVQRGPLAIDYDDTWNRHEQFHAQWSEKLAEERCMMQAVRPALVLSDISWLAIEAAAGIGIPAVGLCNLTWDQVLEPHLVPGREGHIRVLHGIREAYRKAQFMIRLAPGLPMPAFTQVRDVGPVVHMGPLPPYDLRASLNIPAGERTVLVGFGGIPLEALPFDRMDAMTGYQFLISGPVPPGLRRVQSIDAVPVPFNTLLKHADIVMTKPGYSTVVQAVAWQRPVVYVRRYNFADEEPLVDFLHRYGKSAELSAADFHSGQWEKALELIDHAPSPDQPSPPCTGAVQAAEMLAPYFQQT